MNKLCDVFFPSTSNFLSDTRLFMQAEIKPCSHNHTSTAFPFKLRLYLFSENRFLQPVQIII